MTTAGIAGSPDLSALPIQVLEPWRPGVLQRLKELWQDRRLIPYYGGRYVERRYRNTWLGWLWIPLRPGLDVVSKAFLYGGLLGVSSGDRPYIIFITFGTCGWVMFESTTRWAARAMRWSAQFVRNAHAPRLPKLAGVLFSAGLDFFLYVLVAAVAIVYFVIAKDVLYLVASVQVLTAVAGIIMLAMFGFAVGLWTSPWSTYTRDVRFSFTYVLQFWYYVTPIIYPISSLPPKFQPIAEYNPLTAPIEMVKFGFLATAPPTSKSLIVAFAGLFVLMVGGLWTFSRLEGGAVARM